MGTLQGVAAQAALPRLFLEVQTGTLNSLDDNAHGHNPAQPGTKPVLFTPRNIVHRFFPFK